MPLTNDLVLRSNDSLGLSDGQPPKYQRDLSSPVTRIFDVVKSASRSAELNTASFVVLPQPIVASGGPPRDKKLTFVGLTDGGHYALSEGSYPLVTDGAQKAAFYSKWVDWRHVSHRERQEVLVGIHSVQDEHQKPHTVSRPRGYVEEPVMPGDTSLPLPSLGGSKLLGLAVSNPVDLSIVVLLFSVMFWVLRGPKKGISFGYLDTTRSPGVRQDNVKEIIIPGDGVPKKHDTEVHITQPEGVPNPAAPLVEEPVIAMEETQILAEEITEEETQIREVRFNPQPEEIKVEAEIPEVPEVILVAPPATPKKKKAHRGQRGGKKRGKGNSNPDKEEGDRIDRIVNDAKKVEQELPLQPDMTDRSSANDVETSLVSINGLDVYEDQILGKLSNTRV